MIIDIHGHIGTWPVFFIPEPSDEWLVRTNRSVGIERCGVSHLLAIGYDTERGRPEVEWRARSMARRESDPSHGTPTSRRAH